MGIGWVLTDMAHRLYPFGIITPLERGTVLAMCVMFVFKGLRRWPLIRENAVVLHHAENRIGIRTHEPGSCMHVL